MTRTYDGVTYTVLDLNALRSGYLGSSSLTRAVCVAGDPPATRAPRSGRRISPEREAEVRRRLAMGESSRVIVNALGVHWETVRRIRALMSGEQKRRKDAGIPTGRRPTNATSPEMIAQWAAWRAAGWTYRMIADRSGVFLQVVHRALLARAQQEGEAA